MNTLVSTLLVVPGAMFVTPCKFALSEVTSDAVAAQLKFVLLAPCTNPSHTQQLLLLLLDMLTCLVHLVYGVVHLAAPHKCYQASLYSQKLLPDYNVYSARLTHCTKQSSNP